MSDEQVVDSHGHRSWTRDGFYLSTDPTLISIPALKSAYGSEWVYWAKPMPTQAMKAMISNSLCFGLYTPTPGSGAATPALTRGASSSNLLVPGDMISRPQTPSATTGTSMIGFARLITDHTTVAYLTDVYILPGWRGEGLGRWLVGCVQEVLEGMPLLRGSLLVTGKEAKAQAFYKQVMKMERMEAGGKYVVMGWDGPGCTQ